MYFQVPVRIHRPGSKTKASISYVVGWVDYGTGPEPRYLPGPGTKLITIQASSNKDASLKLAEIVMPGDPRPIMGRRNVRLFRAE